MPWSSLCPLMAELLGKAKIDLSDMANFDVLQQVKSYRFSF